MLQLRVIVGTIDGREVSIRRSTDGSIIVHIKDDKCEATYQRIQQGLLLINSTFTAELNKQLYNSLMMNLKEIDRRSIEMSEAELRVAYKVVTKVEGYTIQVGQSNSLIIFIVVEKSGKRALLQYASKTVTFISTTFTKEENAKIRDIIASNMLLIVESMHKYNMLPNKDKAPHLYATDGSTLDSGMTATGVKERAKVDRHISSIFNALEQSGYSNLEIQALLMESVLEIAMQSRIVNKDMGSVKTSAEVTAETLLPKKERTVVETQKGISVQQNSIRQVVPRVQSKKI
jgi:hypothetical protein